jgi:hypothetical protein
VNETNGYHTINVKICITEPTQLIETGNIKRILVGKHLENQSTEKLKRKKLN